LKPFVRESNSVEYELDFQTLDDLALTPAERAVELQIICVVRELGPAIEYEFLASQPGTALSPLTTISASQLATTTSRIVRSPFMPLTDLAVHARDFEVVRIPSDQQAPGWQAFLRRAANAGAVAGFESVMAKGFIGALKELISNVFDHSENASSAVAGYRYGPAHIELVVADAGIGTLQSLRTNPVYSHIRDHGEALAVAMSSGATRFEQGTGHGTGFDSVFRNIAAVSGAVRFRSGDHSAEIAGRSISATDAHIRQRAPFQGFLAVINCRV
jgi:hypothetical protein